MQPWTPTGDTALVQDATESARYYTTRLPTHISYHWTESGREYLYDSVSGQTRWLWERTATPPWMMSAGGLPCYYVNCVDGRTHWSLPIVQAASGSDHLGIGEVHKGDAAMAGGCYGETSEVKSLESACQRRWMGPRPAKELENREHPTASRGREAVDRECARPTQPAACAAPNCERTSVASRAESVTEEEVRRRARAARFRQHLQPHRTRRLEMAPTANVGAATTPSWSPSSPITDRLVGTNARLEKSYLRLTTAARASEVRPLPVLQRAFQSLRDRWQQHQVEYGYVCEQLKAMRQDLQVQGIGATHRLAFDVYEMHARIALRHYDLAEYSQCQSVLQSMYRENASEGAAHRREFLAYRILYAVYTGAYLDLTLWLRDVMRDGSEEQRVLSATLDETDAVAHAMQVVRAVRLGNYHRFTRLHALAPHQSAYLMDCIAVRVRSAAVMTIVCAYRPTLPLTWVASELGMQRAAAVRARSRHERAGAEAQVSEEHCLRATAELLEQHRAVVHRDQAVLECGERMRQRVRPPDDLSVWLPRAEQIRQTH
ncbi:hypothetical protein CDCA_CDCA09G2689 [Cyanidium caldarium]|uniref:SAC3/GANP/THP3 conserved domain-containing protein n=1 Tax=Cyanidium caldarium TaxID=2771 RepID=A0AAV9IWK3_CYACA|nr:hypothetical protein CDCA_CDCA09G2689 [Cyanidium caldarium]